MLIHTEANLSGAAHDFHVYHDKMGLSQVVSGSTHVAGSTFELVFCTGLNGDDLDMEGLLLVPLSWTDPHLVGFRLIGTLCHGDN